MPKVIGQILSPANPGHPPNEKRLLSHLCERLLHNNFDDLQAFRARCPQNAGPPISQNELNNTVIKEIGYKGMKYLKHNQGWLINAVRPSYLHAAWLLLKKNTSSQRNCKLNKKIKRKKKQLHPGEKNIPKQQKTSLHLRTFPPCVVFFIKKPRAPYRYNLYNQRWSIPRYSFGACRVEKMVKSRGFHAWFLAAWPSSAREGTTPLATKMTCSPGRMMQSWYFFMTFCGALWISWVMFVIVFASFCLVCGYLVALKQHPRKQ